MKLFKAFCDFKNNNNLEYRKAFGIFLDLLKGGITKKSLRENEKYANNCLPLILEYLLEQKEHPYRDNLGLLYEKCVSEFGKVIHAQHFTPEGISDLLGSLATCNATKVKVVRLNDMCCGFGSIPLSFVKQYKQKKTLHLFINDIDPVCVTACFIQCYFALIKKNIDFKITATQGNILTHPNGEKFMYAVNLDFNEIMNTYHLIGFD